MKKLLTLILLLTSIVTVSINAQNRHVRLLDQNWKFKKGEVSNEHVLSFDDSRWENVFVPHDWAISGSFNLNEDMQNVKIIENGDQEVSLKTGRTGALPATGIGWYRKVLFLPSSNSKKRVFVEFDGAMSNAKIYLNEKYVGEWPYGYASFSFDITEYFRFGENNILAVRLENKPEMSRFYSGAGIYRPVRLVTTAPVHVAHWGTYITTPEVSLRQGKVNIQTRINNNLPDRGEVKLITKICENNGKIVSTITSYKKLVEKELDFNQNCVVKKPTLWDTETPYLYKAISEIYVNNELVDTYETTFGFRTLEFDKKKGFFLNGKYTKIKGVCLHHDLGPLGAAINRRATERQIEMMKEMGCNAIRTSHNPPSLEMLNICDSMGMMVQVEVFDEWKAAKCVNGYNTLFDQWAEKDLSAVIRRDRNHPSVIMWSIGNELREQDMEEGGALASFLSDIAHREDPTRPTTAGYNNHIAAINNGLADAVDLVGFNYKHYDYTNHPNYTLYGSETSSAVSSRGVYKFPVKDNWTPWYDDYQVSSYDMDYVPWGSAPDTEFEKQDDNPFLLGEFVWTGFDYLGEPSPYGEGAPSRSSYFGIVDLAGLKKDRFYLYQSQWSNKDVLHVMPHWTWPDRLNQQVPIQCYTTYPKVELFVNGVSMGIKEKDAKNKFTRYRMMWEDVIYQPGEIKVVALNEHNVPQAERVIKTAGDSNKILLTPDRRTITADGKDLSFITIEVLDENDNLCPRASSLMFVQVRGNGILKGLCNGDATDLIPFTSNYMKVFNGKMVAIVESTPDAGEIEIIVSSERLSEGKISVISEK